MYLYQNASPIGGESEIVPKPADASYPFDIRSTPEWVKHANNGESFYGNDDFVGQSVGVGFGDFLIGEGGTGG